MHSKPSSVVAVLIVGFGASLLCFRHGNEQRQGPERRHRRISVSLDRQNANRLPVENIHDMTFVDP